MSKAKDIFFISVITLMLIGTAAINKANAAPVAKDAPKNQATAKSYVVKGVRYQPMKSVSNFNQTGKASWYGPGFHGRKTSNGERFNMHALTAAHRTLPIPSYVRVTNLANGKSVVVRVNDRGPFHGNRVIDLSKGAANQLGFLSKGMAQVRIESLDASGHATQLAEVKSNVSPDKFEKVAVTLPKAVEPLKLNKAQLAKLDHQQAALVTKRLATAALTQNAFAAFAPKESAVYLDSPVFANAKEANAYMLKMAERLRSAQINYPLVLVEAEKGFQVRMGPFKEQKHADEMKSQLRELAQQTI